MWRPSVLGRQAPLKSIRLVDPASHPTTSAFMGWFIFQKVIVIFSSFHQPGSSEQMHNATLVLCVSLPDKLGTDFLVTDLQVRCQRSKITGNWHRISHRALARHLDRVASPWVQVPLAAFIYLFYL